MGIKIKVIWKNKHKIITGIWNSWFPSLFVKRVANRRIKICRSNQCGHYDAHGESSKCYVAYSECCDACGCKLKWATHSLSKTCGLVELGEEPLWKAEMTEKEEQEFEHKTGIVNQN